MRTLTTKVKVENYWGKPLAELECTAENKPKVLKFDTTYDAFGVGKNEKTYTDADWDAAYEEMLAAGKVPSKRDIVRTACNTLKAAARGRAILAAVLAAGFVQPTLDTDREMQIDSVYKGIFAAGNSNGKTMTAEEARAKAIAVLGFEPETDDTEDAE